MQNQFWVILRFKEHVKRLILNGHLKEALKEMLRIVGLYHQKNKFYENDLIGLSGALEQLEREKNRGTSSVEAYQLGRKKMTESLLFFLSKIILPTVKFYKNILKITIVFILLSLMTCQIKKHILAPTVIYYGRVHGIEKEKTVWQDIRVFEIHNPSNYAPIDSNGYYELESPMNKDPILRCQQKVNNQIKTCEQPSRILNQTKDKGQKIPVDFIWGGRACDFNY